jgi:lipase
VYTDPAELDVPRPDGTLRVLRWGRGPRHAVALHGITASAAAWLPVAEALPTEWSLFAVDLRGRGHSGELPGPYGFGRHAEDVLAAVDHLGLEQPVLAGHSLGAYLALLIADQAPGTFAGLLLADGGLPQPVPDGVDLDALLDAGLGPALARLRETYPSVEAYFDFWRAHPAMKDAWNEYLEYYLRYDLTGEDGVLRSRVSEQAARADGRELLGAGERLGAALRGLGRPVRLLTAPAGMFGQPPGMLPPELCEYWAAQAPMLTVETVPGANHYTLVLDPGHAATVARRLTEA